MLCWKSWSKHPVLERKGKREILNGGLLGEVAVVRQVFLFGVFECPLGHAGRCCTGIVPVLGYRDRRYFNTAAVRLSERINRTDIRTYR